MTVRPAECFSGFKQTSKLFVLGVFCLALITFMMIFKAYARQDSGAKECIPIRMSFIQPWGDEYFPNPRLWRSELLAHQRLGIEEVILQWTMWGSDLQDEIKLPLWLEAAIMGADEAGAKLWFGLRYDPTFMEKLQKDGQAYLDNRLAETEKLATAIRAQISYTTHPTEVFAGWYIPDEIDGNLLLDSKLKQLVTGYTKQTRAILNRILPGPVAISGYTDLKTIPRKLATQWNKLMAKSSMDILLLQDGLGAKLMEPYSSRNLQRAISAAFSTQDHTVIPVVEIFEIDPRTADFSTIPTTLGTMKSRLKNARFSPAQPLALFSLSSHILKFDNKHSREIKEFLTQNAHVCGASTLANAEAAE
ncbi:hypothetical protein PsAD13_03340 [Pseudovibrio sp. Ad13]|uniref:DUF4434 domain-containing protein n=1 Tax=Pseudovibrio sp. Ad13 TaxID=989396 RepID=UPI0007B186C6|nr:DUF4434 domain-containing protein [Pseudovibrio sp. Ad13]KZK83135.1 hypothetical protein PsAD13_03340 [Pseudovibrio sp. Ad13]